MASSVSRVRIAPACAAKHGSFGNKRSSVACRRAEIGNHSHSFEQKARSAFKSRAAEDLHADALNVSTNALGSVRTDSSSKQEGTQIVWFRVGDLRTHDHPGLVAVAKDTSAKVVPVFVYDETELRDFTPATIRAAHEAVAQLATNLQATPGLTLVIRIGDPAVELPKLCNELNASQVTVQMELEWARRATYVKTLSLCRENPNVSIREWELRLREATDLSTQKETAVLATVTGNAKSAPLTAWTIPEVYANARGPIVAPTPAPVEFEARGVDGYSAVAKRNDQNESDEKRPANAGSLPALKTVLSWSKTLDEPDDIAHDAAVALATAAMNDPSIQKARKSTGSENSFVLVSEVATQKRAAEEAGKVTPVVPFRLPGGETSAVRFFNGFLDFYTATNDKEFKRLYDRVIEVGKPNAFFLLFGNALRTGALSPNLVYDTCNKWEAQSKRATDVCANARNIATLRDHQAAVASDFLKAKVYGPGVPLVGAYNCSSGKL